eukprot:993933-Prymnesium_polylepis.2
MPSRSAGLWLWLPCAAAPGARFRRFRKGLQRCATLGFDTSGLTRPIRREEHDQPRARGHKEVMACPSHTTDEHTAVQSGPCPACGAARYLARWLSPWRAPDHFLSRVGHDLSQGERKTPVLHHSGTRQLFLSNVQ